MTQQNVADVCGISREAVAQWESANPNKRTRPDIDNLRKFADAAGVELWWLIDESAELDAMRIASPEPPRLASAVREAGAAYEADPDFQRRTAPEPPLLRGVRRADQWATQSDGHTRLAAALDRHAAQLSPEMADSIAVMIESAAGRRR